MDEKEAFEMGKDCAKNGANITNCNISIFATPELTKAWEKGSTETKDGTKE